MHSRGAFVLEQVRAEPVEEAHVRAFLEQPVVHGAEDRAVGVGVVDHPSVRAARRLQSIWGPGRDMAREEPAGMQPRQVREQLAAAPDGIDGLRAGNKGPDGDGAVRVMRAEHREGVVMAARDDRLDDAGGEGRGQVRTPQLDRGAAAPVAGSASVRQISRA